MKSNKKLWTFQSPNGYRSQIDYVLVRSKWKNSVRNSQAFSSFSSLSSDHRIVSATIKLSLRASKKIKPHPMKQIDWTRVNADPELSSKFTVEVHNKFNALSSPDDDIETMYNNIIQSTEVTALITLPKKPIVKHAKFSSHQQVLEARNEVIEAVKLHHQNPSEDTERKVKQSHHNLDLAYVVAQTEFVQGKLMPFLTLI